MPELFDFDDDAEITREKHRPIKIEHINILRQPRTTFEKESLEALRANIFSPICLLYSPIVALYDRVAAQQHLAYVNELWGTDYALDDLTQWGAYWLILLAGERRIRAAKEKAEVIAVQLWRGLTPFLALHIQFSENIQVPLDPEDEATAHDQFYRLYQKEGKDISVPQYADWVGRSPSMIRRALKYGKLPIGVQELVTKGVIPYSIALQLGRLQKVGITPDKLESIGVRVSLLELTAEEFKKNYVDKKIEEEKNGQTKLFPNPDDLEEKNREEAGKRYSRKVRENQAYFDLLYDLIDKDLMGIPEMPLSSGGPSRRLTKEIDAVSRILEQFADEWFSKNQRVMLAKKAAHMQKVLSANGETITEKEPR